MQLKLRVGVGDTLTIDVKPTDTFQDLSDRLYDCGGVEVDLSQLKSNDKPFDMTTNVINYFIPKSKDNEENGKPRRLCRLCSESINNNPVYLFEDDSINNEEEKVTLVEKVNSSLPIHVSVQDHLPKQICESCHSRVNKSFDFMKKVVDAQRTLEQVYNTKPKDKPSSNYTQDECCPLCTFGHFKHVDNQLRTLNGPQKCEKLLRKEVVISVPKNANARKDLNIGRPTYIKEEPIDPEYYDDDIVTGFWDPSNHDSSVDMYGMKRYRKRMKMDDDVDWTIDEEYVPVSRRGRPRGTKNKPKVQVPVVEKSCVLCGWLGADTDMFAHAINQHCQPDMGYFPCPLCKTNQPNEMVLETHIDRHNARKRDK